jgi:DNA helicase-2/ATP-dependent DNA helicase PcrA
MTIHSAKGLEFKYVYVVGLEENLFPSQMALQSRAELEEERRLFYVAITRAEKQLTLSYAVSRYKWGNLISCEPSRFIAEINPDFINDQTALVTRINDFDRQRNWSDFGKRNSPVTSSGRTETAVVHPGGNFKKVSALKSAPAETAASLPFEADDAGSITTGMDVEHQKFGTGRVILIEGTYPELKATVAFPGHGNKQLLLKYAKLRIVR